MPSRGWTPRASWLAISKAAVLTRAASLSASALLGCQSLLGIEEGRLRLEGADSGVAGTRAAGGADAQHTPDGGVAGDPGSNTGGGSGSGGAGGSADPAAGGSGAGAGAQNGGTGGSSAPPVTALCSAAGPGELTCNELSVVECSEDRSSAAFVEDCFACREGQCFCPAGTSVSDGVGAESCAACADGSFSAAEDASGCTEWQACGAGEFVVAEGTTTTDRQCEGCADGTFNTVTNADACANLQSCGAGQFVADEGSTVADRDCDPCGNGTFSTSENVAACTAFQTCAAGQFISQPGSTTINRQCARCDVGTVSLTANTTGCLPAQMATGEAHSCALLTGGNVRCWGAGLLGQLGYGGAADIGDTETPASAGNVDVGGPVAQIAAGYNHTCAVLTNGSVRCWGDGTSGQLGNEDVVVIGDTELPSSVAFIDVGGTVSQITAGRLHTCALMADGNVRCWGDGSVGRLGYADIATIGDDEAPAIAGNVEVGGTVRQIAAGGAHTCALLTTGSVRCWGDGTGGRLGYGDTVSIGDTETPASAGNVEIGGTVAQIAAGDSHTCALLTNGNVRCWGGGSVGQLGYAATANIGDDEDPLTAGDVDVGATVARIAAGGNHTCALTTGGNVRCWGEGSTGRLGYAATVNIGNNEDPSSAGNVNVGATVTQVAAGGTHTCALLTNGNARCWGGGGNGKLGYGGTADIGDNETPASAGNVPFL